MDFSYSILDQRISDAYANHVAMTIDRLQTDLNHAFEATATEGILTLDSQLDHAYNSFQQQARFEEEQSEVVEQYTKSQRRRQAIIIALVLLVVLLIVYIIAYTMTDAPQPTAEAQMEAIAQKRGASRRSPSSSKMAGYHSNARKSCMRRERSCSFPCGTN